jgi:DNA repair exonuclease SbcCD ATPase subunit
MNERPHPNTTQAAAELLSVASEINRLKDALSAQVKASQQLDLLVAELQRVSMTVQALPGAIGSVADKGLGFIARAETALAPAHDALTGLESLKKDLVTSMAETGRLLSDKVSEVAQSANATRSLVDSLGDLRGDITSRVEKLILDASRASSESLKETRAELNDRQERLLAELSKRAAESDTRIQELTKAISTVGAMTSRIGKLLESRAKEESQFRQEVMEKLSRLEALETRSGFSKALGLGS